LYLSFPDGAAFKYKKVLTFLQVLSEPAAFQFVSIDGRLASDFPKRLSGMSPPLFIVLPPSGIPL
jgi:hypothetical protein